VVTDPEVASAHGPWLPRHDSQRSRATETRGHGNSFLRPAEAGSTHTPPGGCHVEHAKTDNVFTQFYGLLSDSRAQASAP